MNLPVNAVSFPADRYTPGDPDPERNPVLLLCLPVEAFSFPEYADQRTTTRMSAASEHAHTVAEKPLFRLLKVCSSRQAVMRCVGYISDCRGGSRSTLEGAWAKSRNTVLPLRSYAFSILLAAPGKSDKCPEKAGGVNSCQTGQSGSSAQVAECCVCRKLISGKMFRHILL